MKEVSENESDTYEQDNNGTVYEKQTTRKTFERNNAPVANVSGEDKLVRTFVIETDASGHETIYEEDVIIHKVPGQGTTSTTSGRRAIGGFGGSSASSSASASSGAGAQGPQGPQGAQGPQGPAGPGGYGSGSAAASAAASAGSGYGQGGSGGQPWFGGRKVCRLSRNQFVVKVGTRRQPCATC